MSTQPINDRAPFSERPVQDVLLEASYRADWALLRGVYSQCIDIAADPSARFMPDPLVGYLAEVLGRLAANYHGEEQEFALHVLAVLGDVEGAARLNPSLFRRLYRDERFDRFKQYAVDDADGLTRRRPRPFETVVETARRFRDVNDLQSVFSSSAAGILGGSTSYGRFFNVAGPRGPREASDVELLVVLPSYRHLSYLLDGLRSVDGIAPRDIDAVKERARWFGRLGLDDGSTIFSHRFTLWGERADPTMAWADVSSTYVVSLYVLSREVLDWILVRDAPKLDLDPEHVGERRSVRVYRESESTDRYEVQRGFSGKYRRIAADSKPVDGGHLRESGVFSIHEDRYFPGMFQNLVFPRFDVRWDTLQMRGAVEAFRYKMIERLRYERMTRPYEMLLFSLAHTRAEAFAPNVLARVDGGVAQ